MENAMDMKKMSHAVIFNPLGKLSTSEFTPNELKLELELFIFAPKS